MVLSRGDSYKAEDLLTNCGVGLGPGEPGRPTGEAWSRHPTTGDSIPVARFGDDDPTPIGELEAEYGELPGELDGILSRVETYYRKVCHLDFQIGPDGAIVTGARPANLAGPAAVRLAVSLAASDPHGLALSKEESVAMVQPFHLEQVLHDQFGQTRPVELAKGLGVSPGAAVGQVYFSADRALEAYDDGESVILVAAETNPGDVHGMAIAEGILTSSGGMASHAAVVARGWGKPAVCGAAAVRIESDSFWANGKTIREGELISIDGSSGSVYLGEIKITASEPPAELSQLLEWADELRGDRLEIRANADTPADAEKAFELGATGIGLCRTEHQFLGVGLPLIQRYVLADSNEVASEALAELQKAQSQSFVDLLDVVGERPITIRLLDPPLHEFLPTGERLVSLSSQERAQIEYWSEHNPMLGVRGVRLGVIRSELYKMQIEALSAAVASCAGAEPNVELMVPLVVDESELDLVSGWLDEAGGDKISIGTMIETPRAAMRTGQLARTARFVSFGTNDLTQLVFGFSRDDVESKIMSQYLEAGLLQANPFETIDRGAVVPLMASAVEDGRRANPSLKVGVCGEHGGDPASIRAFVEMGVDYVSCSPFRVPIARLVGAHAVCGNKA